MRFPHKLDAREFLSQHWQKKPLFLPGAVADELPRLDADELGWLATLDDVESRLVFTDHADDQAQYRVEQGPFDEQYLATLPDRDWTLLVNDVEKHLPELRPWLALADFVPDWRIDDLMISFAAPGGSVGPHRDNYDVFLCQTLGERDWALARNATAVDTHADLALLKAFTADTRYCARESDVLYLPPGYAHWGVAVSNCLTWSIGMRAPTRQELCVELERHCDRSLSEDADDSQQPAFYVDPDLQLEEATPGMISVAAVERTTALIPGSAGLSLSERATILGCAVTCLKSWLCPALPESAEIEEMLERITDNPGLPVHGMARLAWFSMDPLHLAFLNGAVLDCGRSEIEAFSGLCATRRFDPDRLQCLAQSTDGREFLTWMIGCGAADLSDRTDGC